MRIGLHRCFQKNPIKNPNWWCWICWWNVVVWSVKWCLWKTFTQLEVVTTLPPSACNSHTHLPKSFGKSPLQLMIPGSKKGWRGYPVTLMTSYSCVCSDVNSSFLGSVAPIPRKAPTDQPGTEPSFSLLRSACRRFQQQLCAVSRVKHVVQLEIGSRKVKNK